MVVSGAHAILSGCLLMVVMDVLSSPHPKPIVNGTPAEDNQFPFAVAFGLQAKNSKSKADSILFFCGGSLITQTPRYSWAISAAHCFLDVENQTMFARVGGGDLTAPDVEWLKVLKVISKDFNMYSMQNDVALVKIAGAGPQTIPLAVRPPVFDECLIYGYGSTSFQENTITSSFIRFGSVKPISYERCEKILGRVTAPYEGTGQFCALGSHGVDACNGDSGSGLICRGENGRFELVGITSHGSGCGEGTAGIYESVAFHKQWIEYILRQQSSKRLRS